MFSADDIRLGSFTSYSARTDSKMFKCRKDNISYYKKLCETEPLQVLQLQRAEISNMQNGRRREQKKQLG